MKLGYVLLLFNKLSLYQYENFVLYVRLREEKNKTIMYK